MRDLDDLLAEGFSANLSALRFRANLHTFHALSGRFDIRRRRQAGLRRRRACLAPVRSVLPTCRRAPRQWRG